MNASALSTALLPVVTARHKKIDVNAEAVGYTIDELAAKTKVPSRTIRFYQSKGALAKPNIVGRVAYYNDAHIKRLELISQLQDRGLSIRAIRDLVKRIDAGEVSLNEWLGLEQQLQKSWADDQPKVLSEAELTSLIGESRPGVLAELLRTGNVDKQGDAYIVRSTRLLNIALALLKSGIALEASFKASAIIADYTQKMAHDLLEFYLSRLGKDFAGSASPDEVVRALQSLRPLGIEAVGLLFGQSMERELRRMVESGKLGEIQARLVKQKREYKR